MRKLTKDTSATAYYATLKERVSITIEHWSWSTMGDHVRCVPSVFFPRARENAFSSSREYNRASTCWRGRPCCSPPWVSICRWTDDHGDDDDFELNKPCCDSVQATKRRWPLTDQRSSTDGYHGWLGCRPRSLGLLLGGRSKSNARSGWAALVAPCVTPCL